jgi:RNA polymerase sigma-70 factor (ECF subfamily)
MPMEKKTDLELMNLLVNKNTPALKELYRRYEVQIFNFIFRYTGQRETAQELIQDTFTRLWFAAPTFDYKKGNFKPWLYTIALNLARNEMSKKEHRFRFIDPEEIRDHRELGDDHQGQGPDAVLEQQETDAAVANALGKLQPHLKEVILLKNYHHLKFKEIAEVSRAPESTIKARYHKAISELKKQLNPEEVTSHA